MGESPSLLKPWFPGNVAGKMIAYEQSLCAAQRADALFQALLAIRGQKNAGRTPQTRAAYLSAISSQLQARRWRRKACLRQAGRRHTNKAQSVVPVEAEKQIPRFRGGRSLREPEEKPAAPLGMTRSGMGRPATIPWGASIISPYEKRLRSEAFILLCCALSPHPPAGVCP